MKRLAALDFPSMHRCCFPFLFFSFSLQNTIKIELLKLQCLFPCIERSFLASKKQWWVDGENWVEKVAD